MRVRLRAPDETEPSPQHTSPYAPARLPQLDVNSPEFIEQRLENLKRKPNWLSYLDQYVNAHPDDDEDGEKREVENAEEEDEQTGDDEPWAGDDEPGFFKTLLYSSAIVALTPVWVLAYPVLRNRKPDTWPLGCSSFGALYVLSVSQIVFIALGLVLLYYTMCKALPELDGRGLVVLRTEGHELVDALSACRAGVRTGNEGIIREHCSSLVVDAITFLTIVWLVFKTHRRWGRYALMGVGVLMFLDFPSKVNRALQPSPVIVRVDPDFALLDEEILVALDGKNLQPGGTVAWIAYWGCASTSPVEACDLQFSETFEMGVVPVTFTSIDHFIPCYRNPPNPLKAEDFHCFEDVRLRVKDKQSIPGWSKAIGPPEEKNQAPVPTEKRTPVKTKRRSEKKVKTVGVSAKGELDV
ncbi:hypothetical protein Poli38472_005969 [Pythium oligandrum]|uniref:Uncharacterized protein n=1 Tax=Pythium oligandrum TaxID=41045 RepID=A0A8K1CTU7_PYTOL|nr:hypothetical protein Poli38472_005969 [Pythium oligandrum]|eukprot:TMW68501.1 hypothetical protein Poli38472_005969 [Pythium oligandrum]